MSTHRYPHGASSNNSHRGFTLIELLVVIAVIGVLAGLLFPVFARVRNNSRKTTCASNLHQIGLGIQLYAQDNNGRHPQVAPDANCSLWPGRVASYVKSTEVFQCPSFPEGKYQPGCPAPVTIDEDDPVNGTTKVLRDGSYDLNRPLGSYNLTFSNSGEITYMEAKYPRTTLRESSYLHPASTILILDGDGQFVSPGTQQPPFVGVAGLRAYGVDARHDNGVNIAFADGHVKWMSMEQLTDRKWWLLD